MDETRVEKELEKVEAELRGLDESERVLNEAVKGKRYVVKLGEKRDVIKRDRKKLEARRKGLEAELLRERAIARYAEGPLRLTEKLALKTLERHGRYNRRVLEFLVVEKLWNFPSEQERELDGDLVMEGLVRRGLVEKYDNSSLCLTKRGRLMSARFELEPALKQISAMPDYRFACELESVPEWILLLQIRDTIDFTPVTGLPENMPEQEFASILTDGSAGAVEDLIEKGLVWASPDDLIIAAEDVARKRFMYFRLKHPL